MQSLRATYINNVCAQILAAGAVGDVRGLRELVVELSEEIGVTPQEGGEPIDAFDVVPGAVSWSQISNLFETCSELLDCDTRHRLANHQLELLNAP